VNAYLCETITPSGHHQRDDCARLTLCACSLTARRQIRACRGDKILSTGTSADKGENSAPKETSTSGDSPQTQQVSRLLAWLSHQYIDGFLKMSALIAAIWTVILLLAAKDELHLLIWIEEDKKVYPSPATDDQTLPLSYGGVPVNAARLLSVRIVNYGTKSIGDVKETWSLHLEPPQGARFASLAAPTIEPIATVFSLTTSATSAISLKFGSFQPRAEIGLRLLLMNSEHGQPSVRVSLSGLPHELSLTSPARRLSEKLFVSTTVVVALLFMPFLFREVPKDWNNPKTRRWTVVVAVFLFGILIVLLGWGAAFALGHVVSWFL
jgi:hypothetical protein